MIISRLEHAIVEVSHGRGYSAEEIDLGHLVLLLGGRKCLFVLSKALGLPSVTTVARRFKDIDILASVSQPTKSDVAHNLQASFPVPPVPNHSIPVRGFSLQLDNIALAQRIHLSRESDQMVGFCREHTPGHDLSMQQFGTVESAYHAVYGDVPKFHYGREATVAVFAGFGKANYEPFPALVSPTCKAERAPGLAKTIRLLMDSWQTKVEVYGDLWCVSTDGDAVNRLACHKECVVSELDPMDPLAKHLGELPGLNKVCGLRKETYTSDPKHCMKRGSILY